MTETCPTCTRPLYVTAVRGNRSGIAFCDKHCGRAHTAHLIGADRNALVQSEYLPPRMPVPRAMAAAIDAHMQRIGANGGKRRLVSEDEGDTKRTQGRASTSAAATTSSLSSTAAAATLPSSAFDATTLATSTAPSPLFPPMAPTTATTLETITPLFLPPSQKRAGDSDEDLSRSFKRGTLMEDEPYPRFPPLPPSEAPEKRAARYESPELEEELVRAFKRGARLEDYDPRLATYDQLIELAKLKSPEVGAFMRYDDAARQFMLSAALEPLGFTTQDLYDPKKNPTQISQMLEIVVYVSISMGSATLLSELSRGALTPLQILFAAVCGGPGSEFLVAQLLTSEAFSVALLADATPSQLYRMVISCAVRSLALVSPVLMEALLNEQWIRLAFRAYSSVLLDENVKALRGGEARQCLQSLNDLTMRRAPIRGARLFDTSVETVYITPNMRTMHVACTNYVKGLRILSTAKFLFFVDLTHSPSRIDANTVLRFVEPRTLKDKADVALFYALLLGTFDIALKSNISSPAEDFEAQQRFAQHWEQTTVASKKDYVAQHIVAHPVQFSLLLKTRSSTNIMQYLDAWSAQPEIYVYSEFLTRADPMSEDTTQRMRALEAYAFVFAELYTQYRGARPSPLDDILRRIDCLALRATISRGGIVMRQFSFSLLYSVLQKKQIGVVPQPRIAAEALQLAQESEDVAVASARYLMRCVCSTWTDQYEPDRQLLHDISQMRAIAEPRAQLRFYIKAFLSRHLELLSAVFELGTAEARRVVLSQTHGMEVFIVQLCPWSAVATTADIANLLFTVGNEIDSLAEAFAARQFGVEYDSRGGFALYVYRVWNATVLTALERRDELKVFNVVKLFRDVYSRTKDVQQLPPKRAGFSATADPERMSFEAAITTMGHTPEPLTPPLSESVIGFPWPMWWPLWIEGAWQRPPEQ